MVLDHHLDGLTQDPRRQLNSQLDLQSVWLAVLSEALEGKVRQALARCTGGHMLNSKLS